MFKGLMNYTAENPRCDRTCAWGQCVCHEGHFGCCETEDGFRFWPNVPVERKTVAFFAEQAGIRWRTDTTDVCSFCGQLLIMHHAAQACFPAA